MLKNILSLKNVQELSKTEQKMVNGGKGDSSRCPTYDPDHCRRCGGYPLSNGCCLGTQQTHQCLSGVIQ